MKSVTLAALLTAMLALSVPRHKSTKAFVHYPANTFPGQDKPLKDDTHHNAYGGYELARCVIEGIKANVPTLATHLVKTSALSIRLTPILRRKWTYRQVLQLVR